MTLRTTPHIALAHDYLTQRGGAERVVLSMHKAFPDAPIYTTLYNPETTFPEFQDANIITSPLNHISLFRQDHRLALPFLAPASSMMSIDADLVLTSSTGWAHGFRTSGANIVYCHSPARFLYLEDQYLRSSSKFSPKKLALRFLKKPLTLWDQSAASIPTTYIANSTIVAERISRIYGRKAPIIFPPAGIRRSEAQIPIDALKNIDNFYLVVSRLMPYKNVDKVIKAFQDLPSKNLVIIGSGPEKEYLHSIAPQNIHLLSGLEDSEMAWAYTHCTALIAPSFEDFGLSPIGSILLRKTSHRIARRRLSRYCSRKYHRTILRVPNTRQDPRRCPTF
ncbi:glycosyltransferase [Actinomyces vulturis]|uniref:glycosyltransferase n=1 Tax=Actinomyces vulturis TaxID=1857645 RepID=UPI000B0F671F|nr:glycosyltransferase [Actinomyces vulturis]